MAFTPQKPVGTKGKIYQLRISDEMFDKITSASKKQGVPKQELIRQMIEHCLNEMKQLEAKPKKVAV